MKKIIYLVVFIVLCFTVLADLNAEINLETTSGDISIFANPNSGEGDTYYYFSDELFQPPDIQQSYSGGGTSYGYVIQKIYNMFMKFNYQTKEWDYAEPEFDSGDEYRFWYTFNTYFVPRQEYNQLKNRVANLELEIEALHTLFSEEDICNARLNVVKEFNLSSVKCGDTMYYNNQGELIGLTGIEINQPIEEQIVIEEEIDCTTKAKRTLGIWFAGRNELQQLINLYNRDDQKGFFTYSDILSIEVKDAFKVYWDCIHT